MSTPAKRLFSKLDNNAKHSAEYNINLLLLLYLNLANLSQEANLNS